MTPEEIVLDLGALAAGLCRDAGIGIELTDSHWAFDPVRHVILMSREAMLTHGRDHCAGIVAHEVGHFFVSRYLLFDTPFPSTRCLATLLNAIEDPRCETWMMRRYPGTEAWLAQVGAHYVNRPMPIGLPRILHFVYECARERDRQWQAPAEPLGVPADVVQALAATREARFRYTQILPPLVVDSGPHAEESFHRYRTEVLPRLNHGQGHQAPSAWERIVRVSALDALTLAESSILPEAARLLDADVVQIASALDADHTLQHAAMAALERGCPPPNVVVAKALGSGVGPRGSDKSRWRDVAVRLIEGVMGASPPKGLGDALVRHGGKRVSSSDRSPPPVLTAKPPLELPPPENAYDRVLHPLSPQVDQLVRHLEEILIPRQRLRELAGYPSGYRVDLRRLMQCEADPRQIRTLWHRKTLPERRDASFSLLVDLSGSMHGHKVQAALAGTVLLCETLSRLGVSFAVNGFQNQLIPFCGFDEALTAEVCDRLPGMVLETAGSRPGGNNAHGCNDDGPCLLEAARMLSEQPAVTKVLVVISDGEPNGVRSGPEDLLRAVSQLEAGGEVELVAIGLGPDTGHVRNYYPRSVANVPLGDLAGQIGRVIEQALVG